MTTVTPMLIVSIVTALSLSSSARAEGDGVLVVPLGGNQSVDPFGDPDNVVLAFNIGPNSTVTGVGWTNALLESASATFGSQAMITLSDSAVFQQIDITIFDGLNFTGLFGPESQTIIKVGPDPGQSGPEIFGGEFMVGGDGMLRLEFWESVDNAPNSMDAIWVAGSLLVQYQTIPGPGGLALLGLAMVGMRPPGLRRRV
jgi:hypothetical protein